ncbi:MAG: hypothetical protein LJE64_14790 [Desulfofustis sp.]|jgi:hypothetical protein|nr:hypothetical protein [Desulfofustis sp.]
MKLNRLEIRLSRALLGAAFFCVLQAGSAHGGDSCITCHTDEDLLEEFSSQAGSKTSALQAGSG